MGSEQTSKLNQDITIKGDINIYIFGDISNQSKEISKRYNYNLLKKIFPIEEPDKNGFIALNKSLNDKYFYEFWKLEKIQNIEKEKKNYNSFIFLNGDHNKLSNLLVEHLHELDVHNKNKNVIIYFGENKSIINSIENLSDVSQESLPFLIMIKNISNYDEKLEYINYIPNINSIRNHLSNKKICAEKNLKKISYKALFNYIILKLYRIDMFYNQLGYDLNKVNPFNDINAKISIHLTIGLLGYSGCGKSTLINLVFDELVSKTSSTATDVTTKCSEYYLPIKSKNSEHVGQIRFVDFPGISEEENYIKIVEPEIKKKIKEYSKNMEQIDVALFFIPNGVSREFNKTGLKLVRLLHKNKIKIIFIINGTMNKIVFKQKKNKLKNIINNNEILHDDFSNLINSDYFQYYNQKDRTGISTIFQSIKKIIKNF